MERHRSVLTRLERLRTLLAKGTWNETMSPLGLPKVKHLKVTVKKEKAAAPAAEGAPAGGAAPAEGAAPAGATKPAATKPAAAKPEAAKPKKA